MPNNCGCGSDTHSFNWFNIDGLPCEPCSDAYVCKYHYPAVCAILTVDLPCLDLLAGTNLQAAFVALNDFVCNGANIPFDGQDSSTINFVAGGPAGHEPTAHVKVSATAGNIITINSDGIYAPEPEIPESDEDWKVKVDEDDDPDYLEEQIIGGSDVNDFIEITVTNVAGQLQIKPVIDINALALAICELCVTTPPEVDVDCGEAIVYGAFTVGTPSSGFIQIPITVSGTGPVTVTATASNGSFFGTITQTLNVGVTILSIPIIFNGTGSDGTTEVTVVFSGTQDPVTPCDVDILVSPAEECIPVSIIPFGSMPEGTISIPYDFTIYLSGTQSFFLTDIVAPAWMTVNIVDNDTIEFGGTPTSADAGEDIEVTFTVNNCEGASDVDFSETFTIPQCISYNMSAATGTPSAHYTDCDGVVHDTLITTNTVICTNGRSFTISSGSITLNSTVVGDC